MSPMGKCISLVPLPSSTKYTSFDCHVRIYIFFSSLGIKLYRNTVMGEKIKLFKDRNAEYFSVARDEENTSRITVRGKQTAQLAG